MEMLLLRQPLLSHIITRTPVLVLDNNWRITLENDLKFLALPTIGAYLVLLMGNATAQSAATITTSSFEIATNQLKTKCIERLCLGASATELMTFGSIEWSKKTPPTGLLSCNHNQGQTATARFKSIDDDHYSVNFDIVRDWGPPLSRYRVVSILIQLKDDASGRLSKIVASSWAEHLKFPASTDQSSRTMTTLDKQFFLIIDHTLAPSKNGTSVALASTYNFKDKWLQTFPQCRTKATQPL
jgi:hypothetical protein